MRAAHQQFNASGSLVGSSAVALEGFSTAVAVPTGKSSVRLDAPRPAAAAAAVVAEPSSGLPHAAQFPTSGLRLDAGNATPGGVAYFADPPPDHLQQQIQSGSAPAYYVLSSQGGAAPFFPQLLSGNPQSSHTVGGGGAQTSASPVAAYAVHQPSVYPSNPSSSTPQYAYYMVPAAGSMGASSQAPLYITNSAGAAPVSGETVSPANPNQASFLYYPLNPQSGGATGMSGSLPMVSPPPGCVWRPSLGAAGKIQSSAPHEQQPQQHPSPSVFTTATVPCTVVRTSQGDGAIAGGGGAAMLQGSFLNSIGLPYNLSLGSTNATGALPLPSFSLPTLTGDPSQLQSSQQQQQQAAAASFNSAFLSQLAQNSQIAILGAPPHSQMEDLQSSKQRQGGQLVAHSMGSYAGTGAAGMVVMDNRLAPPEYDEVRQQIAKRRRPLLRSGNGHNVHGSLQGNCRYFAYNVAGALQYCRRPEVAVNDAQMLPLFIQMFPCELRDRSIVVLNSIIMATCGHEFYFGEPIPQETGSDAESSTRDVELAASNSLVGRPLPSSLMPQSGNESYDLNGTTTDAPSIRIAGDDCYPTSYQPTGDVGSCVKVATVVGVEPRSETSFIALVRTNAVWHLIHNIRCRALLDRHGFWYAETMEQYMRMKEYCEYIRTLPQDERHARTDGLPCMPLVVEISKSISTSTITSPPAPTSFDKLEPMKPLGKHRYGTL